MPSFFSASSLFSSLSNIFDTRLCRNKRTGCLDQLSDDVLIDHIFLYLNVEDVMSMRRVSKLYYYLTHQPIVWKRFLRLINLPLPPLPPTSRFAFGSLTCLEAERLVIRAITLDDNWRSPKPKVFRVESLFTKAEILSMKVLPGGKYLIASVRDPGHHRYSVMVYILDRPTGGAIPLAKTPTGTKAYHLQAKYMVVNGVQGIAIAYVRRDFRRGAPKIDGLDPSDYSIDTDIDTPFPFQYECICLHVSLASLELLGECRYRPGSPEFYEFARSQPPPFNIISKLRSTSELGNVSLDGITGTPFLAVIKCPESIVMKNLNDGVMSTLHCRRWEAYSDTENIICNFRLIPSQRQILIIRKIIPTDPMAGPVPLYPLEIYDIPPPRQEVTWNTLDRTLVDTEGHEAISSFHISDPSIPMQYDLSGLGSPFHSPPTQPPISVFCGINHPDGHALLHIAIWPQILLPPSSPSLNSCSSPQAFHYYTLSNVVHQTHYEFGDKIAHVIPGPYRSLVYTFPGDNRTISPPLADIFSYITPGVRIIDGTEELMKDVGQPQIIMKDRKPSRDDPNAAIRLPRDIKKILRDGGVMSVAWDEAIGRLCIAAAGDFNIYILDFAQTPKLDITGQRLPVPLPDERMLDR